MKRTLIAGVVALAAGGQALAADLPQPPPPRAPATFIPPPPPFTWSGIYIGANAGYSFGTTTPSGGSGVTTNGAVAGGTIGWNVQTGAFVFGAEGDFDWDSIKGSPTSAAAVAVCPNGGCQVSSNWLATARGRVGVAWDRVLVYVTGGAAFQQLKVTVPPSSATADPFGWTGGGGVEFAISPNWSLKAEYLFVDFTNKAIAGTTFNLTENVVRGGVNYRF